MSSRNARAFVLLAPSAGLASLCHSGELERAKNMTALLSYLLYDRNAAGSQDRNAKKLKAARRKITPRRSLAKLNIAQPQAAMFWPKARIGLEAAARGGDIPPAIPQDFLQ